LLTWVNRVIPRQRPTAQFSHHRQDALWFKSRVSVRLGSNLTAHDHGAPLRLVETVSAVNEQRKRAMARKVVAGSWRVGAW
jgi:hypothetical protein